MSAVVFQRATPRSVLLTEARGNAQRTEIQGLSTMSGQEKWVTLTPAEFALLQEYTQCK